MQQWLGEGELRLDVMNSEIVVMTVLRHSNGKRAIFRCRRDCHCYCSLPEGVTSLLISQQFEPWRCCRANLLSVETCAESHCQRQMTQMFLGEISKGLDQ